MAREFVSCERGQLLLMPPSLVEWLPEDHPVWTIWGAVDVMDLDRFCEGYRLGGVGRAPYDPRMMGWIYERPATPPPLPLLMTGAEGRGAQAWLLCATARCSRRKAGAQVDEKRSFVDAGRLGFVSGPKSVEN